MNSTLRSLQQITPVLLRHLSSYFELAKQDIAETKRDVIARLRITVVLVISGVFSLLMACLFVVALTWDSSNRLLAIGLMGGIFALITGLTAIYFISRRPVQSFETVQREWQVDRVIISRLLSSDNHG